MARSDIWRSVRHSDKAKEVAYLTKSVSDYFGSASGDRTYDVQWPQTQALQALGATDTDKKIVLLNPSMLNGQEAPFDGSYVDHMIGVAAHEAGHSLLEAKRDTYRQARSWHKQRKFPRNGNEVHRAIQNIVEDYCIDVALFRKFNRGMGQLTAHSRDTDKAEVTGKCLEVWKSNRSLASLELLSLWGVMRIYREPLPVYEHRAEELRVAALCDDELNKFDTWKSGLLVEATLNLIESTVNEIKRIIVHEYTPEPQATPQADATQGSEGMPQEAASQGLGKSESEDDESETSDSSSSGSNGSSEDGLQTDNASSEASNESAQGSGSSGASAQGQEQELPSAFTTEIPEACPSQQYEDTPAETELQNQDFWRDVKEELASLEVKKYRAMTERDLNKWTNASIVAKITHNYERLASEPCRAKRQDSGRIDRRKLHELPYRDTVFTKLREVKLEGQSVLILDLSGSMHGMEKLVKQVAASIYVALQRTDIDCYVYSYGEVTRQLATPHKISSFFNSVRAGGGTPTDDGFEAVLRDVPSLKHLSRENVIFHVTDGQPNDSRRAKEQMELAAKKGWDVVNIYVSRWVSSSMKADMDLQYPTAVNYVLKSYEDLPRVVEQTITALLKGKKGRV